MSLESVLNVIDNILQDGYWNEVQPLTLAQQLILRYLYSKIVKFLQGKATLKEVSFFNKQDSFFGLLLIHFICLGQIQVIYDYLFLNFCNSVTHDFTQRDFNNSFEILRDTVQFSPSKMKEVLAWQLMEIDLEELRYRVKGLEELRYRVKGLATAAMVTKKSVLSSQHVFAQNKLDKLIYTLNNSLFPDHSLVQKLIAEFILAQLDAFFYKESKVALQKLCSDKLAKKVSEVFFSFRAEAVESIGQGLRMFLVNAEDDQLLGCLSCQEIDTRAFHYHSQYLSRMKVDCLLEQINNVQNGLLCCIPINSSKLAPNVTKKDPAGIKALIASMKQKLAKEKFVEQPAVEENVLSKPAP